ncbi:MAG: hypothetical protein IPJ98_07220 [Bryobacterales bacterium]|nr:hypothetical protein [Bryobacterales bacterium]
MNPPEIKMAVPFDFIVAGKTLPAGAYSLIQANAPSGVPTFIMRNERTRKGVYVVMSQRAAADAANNQAQAVFTCRAADCYFREIKVPGMDNFLAPIPKHTPAQTEKLISLNLAR